VSLPPTDPETRLTRQLVLTTCGGCPRGTCLVPRLVHLTSRPHLKLLVLGLAVLILLAGFGGHEHHIRPWRHAYDALNLTRPRDPSKTCAIDHLRLRSMLNPTCLPPIHPSACLVPLPSFVTLAERSTFPGTQDTNPITAPGLSLCTTP
jgi:hypothetical protein